jgi:hypothetical protein
MGALMEVQMNSQGCEFCKNFWMKYPKKRPYRLADNLSQQIMLYQCKECGAYWEEDLRTARVITDEEALQHFSEYFQRRGQ